MDLCQGEACAMMSEIFLTAEMAELRKGNCDMRTIRRLLASMAVQNLFVER